MDPLGSITKLIELLVKFREAQVNDRLLILNQCVSPLAAAMDALHNRYLHNFRDYRAAIEQDDALDDLSQRLGIDLTEILAVRANVAHSLRTLRKTLPKRTDRLEGSLQAVGVSILDYLDLSGSREFHTIWSELDSLRAVGLITRQNPTYDTFTVELAKASSTESRQALSQLIVHIVGEKHKLYLEFLRVVSELKVSLLT